MRGGPVSGTVSLMKSASLLVTVWLSVCGTAAAQEPAPAEAPDEIVVTGRQPGPPLWRVADGDHVLWIFPQLSPVPKDMVWQSDRVAAVIAQAQEALGLPNFGADVSPRLYLNPVNLIRGMRLAKRLSRDTAGRMLEEVLSPDVYSRFAALAAVSGPMSTLMTTSSGYAATNDVTPGGWPVETSVAFGGSVREEWRGAPRLRQDHTGTTRRAIGQR